jgi:hypothetical protein
VHRILVYSSTDKPITPDSDDKLDTGNAHCILDSRLPGNHVLNSESPQSFSNYTAEEHDNINSFIDNDAARCNSKRQRSESPLSDGIAS